MGPWDALLHLVNFFLPALVVGWAAALAAKLLWRPALKGARLARMAHYASAAGAGVLVAGLVLFGHDGKMATYAAMCLATALALWWAGFGPGRR
jgi:hypothetical protein